MCYLPGFLLLEYGNNRFSFFIQTGLHAFDKLVFFTGFNFRSASASCENFFCRLSERTLQLSVTRNGWRILFCMGFIFIWFSIFTKITLFSDTGLQKRIEELQDSHILLEAAYSKKFILPDDSEDNGNHRHYQQNVNNTRCRVNQISDNPPHKQNGCCNIEGVVHRSSRPASGIFR